MVSISGEMEAAEANGTLWAVRKRQQGSRIHFYLLMFGLIIGGALIGLLVCIVLSATGVMPNINFDPLIVIAGMWIGLIVYAHLATPWAIRRVRRRMADRGLKTRFPYSLEISDQEFAMQSGAMRAVTPWSAVTEIFRSKGYWIFMVQITPWYAPARFFPDQAAEKAFIKEALSHMTSQARARSPDAEAFASS
jgi:hypothetical protein